MINVWKRLWIESPIGKVVDNTTIVFNIQTNSMYADIRIPKSRSLRLNNLTLLSDYTWDELMELALQKSFAGYSHANNTDWICFWDRKIDYQPFTGSFDIGHVDTYSSAPLMIEEGVDGDDYREVWKPLLPTSGLCEKYSKVSFVSLVLSKEVVKGKINSNSKGFMVINCDTFIYQIDRRNIKLPQSDSLLDLIHSQKYSRKQVEDILDNYISHYGVKSSDNGDWIVLHSTFPYSENKKLEGTFKMILDNNIVIQTIPEKDTVLYWNVQAMTYNPFF
ncbi:hypothetical protein ABK040_004431 [Willaertia magna]